jgi:hypothetical protein
MARRFLTSIDLTGFAIIGALLNPTSTDPTGLGVGDGGRVWFNSTTSKLKFWNGTTAIDLMDLASTTGTITASRVSDFMTQVFTARLDQLAAPTADVALNGRKITGLADGVAGSDAASYGQVLALINNQVYKAPVRAASTGNLTLSGTQTVDGVALTAGQRILVKDQGGTASNPANGIYVVAAGAWSRASDADTTAEMPPGAIVPVEEGTTNGDKLFMLTTNGPITLGTTALTFAPYGASSGEIGVGGAGLVKTGVTYDVVAGTTGTITVGADTVDVNTARVPRKWQGAIPTASGTVDGLPITISGANVTFNHAAGHRNPLVGIRYGTAGAVPGQKVEVDDGVADTNNVTITLPSAPAANVYDFVVFA